MPVADNDQTTLGTDTPGQTAWGWTGTDWYPLRAGGATADAFGRLRVSEPQSLLAGKNILDNQPLLFDDQEASGSGTGSSWDQDKASVTLTVGDTTAGKRVRQSKWRPMYQPGKSQRAFITFTMDSPQTGLTQAAGIFDDDNGIFLKQADDSVSFVRRSNVTGSAVDTAVDQASWSEDTMDDLDLTKAQIVYIDFEWLGVGIVRCGFVIDGVIRIAHVFTHANAATGVYMSTPNLPVRYEIESDGTPSAASFETICSSVDSEGGLDDIGIARSVDTAAAGFDTANGTSQHPVLAIRLDSAGLGAFVQPNRFDLLCTSTANYKWAILLNPTIAGTALSFTDVASSAVEVATPTSATTISAEGTVLSSGYGSDTNQNRAGVTADLGRFQLGSLIDGTSDIVVLAVQNLASGTETYHASLGWREAV